MRPANGVWGSFDTLRRPQAAAHRFVLSGVYPCVCTHHPGIVGIVVGDAGGPGAAGVTTTAAGRVVEVTPASGSAAPVSPVSEPEAEVSPGAVRAAPWPGWPVVALAGFGLFLGSWFAAAAAGRGRRDRG